MTESEYRTFVATRYIAGSIVRHLSKNGHALNDQRHFPILPKCNQLRFGLCVCLDHCRTSILSARLSLWTPWGTWCFCDAHLGHHELPLTIGDMKLMRVTEDSELYLTDAKVYTVHEAAKWVFSKPKFRPEGRLLGEEAALKKWEQLSARYFERHPQD
ncbi:MAG: hypothetical protein WC551_00960 [Patescibacteria group bacterium]